MMIIGCGFHARSRQVAMLEVAAADLTERRDRRGSGYRDSRLRQALARNRGNFATSTPLKLRATSPGKRSQIYFERLPNGRIIGVLKRYCR